MNVNYLPDWETSSVRYCVSQTYRGRKYAVFGKMTGEDFSQRATRASVIRGARRRIKIALARVERARIRALRRDKARL